MPFKVKLTVQLLQTRTQRLVEARKLYEFQLPFTFSTLPLVAKLVSSCDLIHDFHAELTVKSSSCTMLVN